MNKLLILIHPDCIVEYANGDVDIIKSYINILKSEFAKYDNIIWFKFYSDEYLNQTNKLIFDFLKSIQHQVDRIPINNEQRIGINFNSGELETILISIMMDNDIESIDIGGGYEELCVKDVLESLKWILEKRFKIEVPIKLNKKLLFRHEHKFSKNKPGFEI